MTETALELRLRDWYSTEVRDQVAPPSLRSSVLAIPQEGPRPFIRLVTRRGVTLLAAAAVIAALGVALGGGVGNVAPPTARPSPSGSPSSSAPADASVVPAPTGLANGPLIVYQTDRTTATVFTLDVETGEKAVLGKAFIPNEQQQVGTYARIQWSSDRATATVLFVGADGGTMAVSRVDVSNRLVTEMIGGIQVVSPLGDAGTRSFGDGAEAIDIEGNSLRNLAFPPGVEVAGAETISKDGRFVAYGSCRPCNAGGKGPDTSTHAHLLVVPFDGSPAHELGDVVVVDRFFWNPGWSPDGKSIAFENLGISVIDVETGVLTQLTKTAGDTNPVWSDDGTRIAFLRNEGTSHGLWVMNADGGNPLQLTSVPGPLEDRLPVWSPDGLTLLFTRNSGLGFGDLWRVPSAGGDRSLFLQNAVADW